MDNPLSRIHPKAKIGPGVTVNDFVSIQEDVEIGANTWIGPNVVIMDGARIGKNCQIFPGAVISAPPQDMKYQGEKTTAEIGDETIIREYVTMNRGTASRGKTVVGNNCLLMAYVHVAHDCIIGNHVIVVNSTGLAGEIEVGDWAVIGGMTAIHQFVKIGAHAMIGGGSLVRKDVPPFVKASREPLSYIGVNSVGLRRRQFTNEKINEIKSIYRVIYQGDMNYSQALQYIESELPVSEERDKIVNFIRGSKRGIMRGYNGSESED
ncbi:MAG TPA: acyl-ACP--UDP-N-acetylglucosamine O-acyltransferase [Bacteroidales bacterium]|nr:acyl-ACP--UDP-N-acetylglucosamine O-acyltransferase [Bacteroidales bacterium]